MKKYNYVLSNVKVLKSTRIKVSDIVKINSNINNQSFKNPISTKKVINNIEYDYNSFVVGLESMLGGIMYKNKFTGFIRENVIFFNSQKDDLINELNCIALEVMNKYNVNINTVYNFTVITDFYEYTEKQGNIQVYQEITANYIKFINRTYRRINKITRINRQYAKLNKFDDYNDNYHIPQKEIDGYTGIEKKFYEKELQAKQRKYINYQLLLSEKSINTTILDNNEYTNLLDKNLLDDCILQGKKSLTKKRYVILQALLNKDNINIKLKENSFTNANQKDITQFKNFL